MHRAFSYLVSVCVCIFHYYVITSLEEEEEKKKNNNNFQILLQCKVSFPARLISSRGSLIRPFLGRDSSSSRVVLCRYHLCYLWPMVKGVQQYPKRVLGHAAS